MREKTEQNDQAKAAKKKALHNSSLLKFSRTSDDAKVNRAIDKLLTDLHLTGHAPKNRAALSHLFIELYAVWKADTSRYIRINLSSNYYTKLARNSKIRISYSSINRIIKKMRQEDLLEFHAGNYNREGEYISGRLSRVRATDKLVDNYFVDLGEPVKIFRTSDNFELIKLRPSKDSVKQDCFFLELKKTDEYKRMDKLLKQYNKFLEMHHIDFDEDIKQEFIKMLPDLSRKTVYRVFNERKSLTLGGRFYGGFWIDCKRFLRSKILINGIETIELDYAAQHTSFLYGLRGAKPHEYPFQIDETKLEHNIHPDRKLLKKVMNIAIGASSPKKCSSAVAKWVNKEIGIKRKLNYFPDGFKIWHINHLLYLLKRSNPLIAEDLCMGKALKLQNLDSRVAEYVIKTLMDKQILVLTVHDSFIVQSHHEEDLRQAMAAAYSHIQVPLALPAISKADGKKELEEAREKYKNSPSQYYEEMTEEDIIYDDYDDEESLIILGII